MTTKHVDIWELCLEIIKGEIGPQAFDTWFRPIKPIKLENHVLTIEVPSQFFYEWLEEHYLGLLKKSIRQTLGPKGLLEYSIVIDNSPHNGKASKVRMPANSHEPSHRNLDPSKQLHANRPIPNPFVIPGIRKFEIESNLNSGLTFDNFIEGDCNRLGRSAGYAVANKPGVTAYNPLFIYGGVGLGKTHLLQAIGNHTKSLFPKKAVLYVSSERFINQFVEASRTGTVNDFMNFYQMIDMLLVDDVQFFAGKEKTQDNFFHVFNHLRTSDKQIVLASDRSPNDLEGMEERLLSRFKWGLNASLGVPDFQTRISILKHKMYSNGIELPDEVTEYIAHHINSNIRELEGALISLLAQSSLNRREVDIDLTRSMLKNFVDKVTREITIDSIQSVVSEHLDVEVQMMKAKTRKREIVQARQIAMFFAKEFTKHSLKSIGSHFGGRDHSTVIHALQTVQDLMSTDKQFKKSVVEIRRKLNMELG
jgi:chromosomal replication initiator protein